MSDTLENKEEIKNEVSLEILENQVSEIKKTNTEILGKLDNAIKNDVPERKVTFSVENDYDSLKNGFNEFILKNTTTTTTSSVLVPPQYSQKIVSLYGNYGVARRNAFIQTLNSNVLHIPRETSLSSGSANYLTEGASATAGNYDVQDVTVNMYALQAELTISKEMLNTAGYDIYGMAQKTINRRFSITEDSQAFMGSANPFTGIFVDSNVNVYTQSASGALNPTLNDLLGMQAKLDATFRNGAKIYCDATCEAKLKGIVDTYGRPIFDPNSNTILGYPYEVISSGVLNSTSVTASGTKYFALANLKEAVWIADLNGGAMEILIDPFAYSSTRKMKYTFTLFSAMGVPQPAAVVLYAIQ
jgi:HK97 family phage major capsid protein